MNRSNDRKSRLMLICAMTIFGTIGIFRRSIPIDSGLLALWRGYVGALSLLLMVTISGRGLDTAALGKNKRLIILSGAMIGLNWMLLFEAYNYTTVAIATICYYMAPVFVMIAAPLIFRRHGSLLKDGLCILAAFGGMVLVSEIGQASTDVDYRGVALGLGAALLYAAVILANQFISDIGAYDKTIGQLAVAATVMLPYVGVRLRDMDFSDWGARTLILLLIVGILHTGLAYALYFGSMDSLSAQSVALLGYIDPIVAVVLSALLLAEPLKPLQIVGIVLVLASTLVGGGA